MRLIIGTISKKITLTKFILFIVIFFQSCSIDSKENQFFNAVTKSDLTKINKPQYDNMIKLARDYHNSVCDNESCIVYQKKVKYLSVSLEPTVSINKFIGYDKIKAGYGVNIYLSSPVFSENTLFYTGIFNYTLTDSAANVRITEIPLQIEYLFGARNFQPKIGLGINLISVKRINYLVHTFNFNTGFNYKFTKYMTKI